MLLKWMYQDRKVTGNITCVLSVSIVHLLLRIFHYILELFWRCGYFSFFIFSVTFYHPYTPWYTFWNATDQCLSRLKLWVLIPLMASCTRYSIMWFSLSVTCDRGTPVSSNNKSDRQDITEILLKVTLNTITLTLKCNVSYL